MSARYANYKCGCGGNVVVNEFLVPCRAAGCVLNGPITFHDGCGQHTTEICEECGRVFYDSQKEERVPVIYMCNQCRAEGIQPGHTYCGQKFLIPEST